MHEKHYSFRNCYLQIGLIFQTCDLQSKVKKYSVENADMAAQLEVYNETQEELTSELADFKEKYREIVNLLHDTQEELKKTKKRTYSGVGTHKLSEMFSASPDVKGKGNSPFCYLYK